MRFHLALSLVLLNLPIASGQIQPQKIATSSDFRGLCAVDRNTAWVSGTKGTVVKTIDAGKTWNLISVPDSEILDFRDVKAFDAQTAYLMSAGIGDLSRIYKTTDGGVSWKLQWKASRKEDFLDALGFWDDENGIALGDPVGGKFQLLVTSDGGRHWQPIDSKNLPEALSGEGAFAASGTCLITQGKNEAWFGTGSAKFARVFHSSDRGKTWTVSETPITAAVESAGIFSLAFRDSKNGIVVGGDYRKPNGTGSTVALTDDGGKTWKLVKDAVTFRSAVGYGSNRIIVAGTSGADVSVDQGRTWKSLDLENYNSVSFAKSGEGWLAGPKGRIAYLPAQ
jgi:photosystem II stability/assembly factor-like uncharacterized protein